jgi:hypothetical protein
MMMMVMTLAGLLLGARTASVPRSPQCSCAFQLATSGTVSFPVGEDSEGEILGGSRLSAASFCLNEDSLFDSSGNPCWFTRESLLLSKHRAYHLLGISSYIRASMRPGCSACEQRIGLLQRRALCSWPNYLLRVRQWHQRRGQYISQAERGRQLRQRYPQC